MLNSLWGYFALNTNKCQYEFVSDEARWNELIHNERFVIHSEYITDETAQLSYSEREEFHEGNGKTNVVIAAFVTSQARVKLYNELDKLGERVLYFDTDSIFYVSSPRFEYEPKLGIYLGDFTNEIDPADGYIIEFTSSGAKSYGYVLSSGRSECTVKGITFNYLTTEILNFDQLSTIVRTDQELVVAVPQYKFMREKYKWTVSTGSLMKKFRFTYDKRIINDDLTTLPFGFCLE